MARDGDDDKASGSSPIVFISYASLDSVVAESTCTALEQGGLTCWIAPRDVTPGAFYADEIVHAIDAARVVVLILSQNAAVSHHVLREVERAASKRHPIASLRIDKAPLPASLEYFLNTSHWLDAHTSGIESTLPKLVEAVQRLVYAKSVEQPGKPADVTTPAWQLLPPPSVESQARRRLSRPVMALCAVAVLGLVGFAAERLWLANHATSERPVAPLTPVAAPPAPAISEKSVAVLPFVDMSEKKDQEYFSDGLSEELIDMLTKIPDLRVPARTSSFYFKGKQTTIADIAKALAVRHVLEGSVRKSGNNLRITAQLIRVDNGYHLWSETYDRQLTDIFKVQDEIATAVVEALKLRLLKVPSPKDLQTSNPDAYDQYLIGRQLLSGSNWAVDRSAAEAFRRAVDLDPTYAPAWARLAEANYDAANDATSAAEFTTKIQEARIAADKAIALRPDLADGYVARAYIRAWFLWDFQAAADDFRRALALEPQNSDVLFYYVGSVLMPTGRLDEAVAVEEKALNADPLNASKWRRLGLIQLFRGDYRAARELLQRSLQINPEQSNTAAFLAHTFLLAGDPASALSLSQRATAAEFRRQGAALAEHDLGKLKEAQQQLDELIAKEAGGAAYQIAEVYAWWGDKEKAFQWLDRAYAQHDGGLVIVKVDPLLRSLRSDARYGAFLRRMNLPE